MMKSRDDWTERDAWRNHGLVSEEDDSGDNGEESGDHNECEDQLKPPPVNITSDNTIRIKAPPISHQINKTKKYSRNTRKGIGKNDKQEMKTSPINLHNSYDLLEISSGDDYQIQEKIIEIAEHDIEKKRETKKKSRTKNERKENVNQNIANISDMKYAEKKIRRKKKCSQGKAEESKTHNKNKEKQLYPALANIEVCKKTLTIEIENIKQASCDFEETCPVEINSICISPDYDQLISRYNKKIIMPEISDLHDIESEKEASTDGRWFSKFINPELLFVGIGYLLVHWYINNRLKK